MEQYKLQGNWLELSGEPVFITPRNTHHIDAELFKTE